MKSQSSKTVTLKDIRLLGRLYIVFAFLLAIPVARKMFAGSAPSFSWQGAPWQAYAVPLFLVLGMCCLALGLKALPIYRAWAKLGEGLGMVVSPLVLGALYFLVVTPFAWVYRRFHKDSLGLGFDPGSPTYWKDPREGKTSRRRLLRQY